jgi:endoribonuclease Dicer
MPYAGYLQDLSQLIEDPLVQFLDTDSALIDGSPKNREASCTIELAPTTLKLMLELDKAADHESEADKATNPLALSPSTNDSEWDEINSMSTSALDLTSSLVFNFPPTVMPPPMVDNPPVEEGDASSMASPALQEKLPMETTVTNIAVSPPSTPSPIPILQADKQQSINKMAAPAHSRPHATTLATRNTDQAIADLRRPSGSRPVGSPISPKPRLTSYAGTRSEPTLSGLPEAPIYLGANAPPSPDDGDEDEPNESSDEEEARPTAKPRKITEQKRRHNAVADSYMHKRTQTQLKEGNKVRPEDEAQQSARWLVNQSENREIISSPREYQVELFEKAKEKNIIAVLDTGTCLLTQFSSSC